MSSTTIVTPPDDDSGEAFDHVEGPTQENNQAAVRDLVKFGFIPSFCIFYYFSTSASFSILLISP